MCRKLYYIFGLIILITSPCLSLNSIDIDVDGYELDEAHPLHNATRVKASILCSKPQEGPQVTGHLHSFVTKLSPQLLKELELSGEDVRVTFNITALAPFVNIETLFLSRLAMSPQDWGVMQALKSLRSLTLEDVDLTTDALALQDPTTLFRAFVNSLQPTLKRLDLSDTRLLTPSLRLRKNAKAADRQAAEERNIAIQAAAVALVDKCRALKLQTLRLSCCEIGPIFFRSFAAQMLQVLWFPSNLDLSGNCIPMADATGFAVDLAKAPSQPSIDIVFEGNDDYSGGFTGRRTTYTTQELKDEIFARLMGNVTIGRE